MEKTPSRAQTILGREPAAWVGLIESVLTLLLAFGLGITQDAYGPVLAVITAAFGVYTAWATKDTALGAIVGLVKSALVLAAVYGLTLTDHQTGAIVLVTTVVVSFFQRTQTSPVLPPGSPLTPSPEPVVVTGVEGDAIGYGAEPAREAGEPAVAGNGDPYVGEHRA